MASQGYGLKGAKKQRKQPGVCAKGGGPVLPQQDFPRHLALLFFSSGRALPSAVLVSLRVSPTRVAFGPWCSQSIPFVALRALPDSSTPAAAPTSSPRGDVLRRHASQIAALAAWRSCRPPSTAHRVLPRSTASASSPLASPTPTTPTRACCLRSARRLPGTPWFHSGPARFRVILGFRLGRS